jgi:hypothetical protein
MRYGGPAKLAEDPTASARLARWGRRVLGTAKIEKFLASAAGTVGVPQGARDVQRMQQYAAMALAAYRETQKARRELGRLAEGNEVIQRKIPRPTEDHQAGPVDRASLDVLCGDADIPIGIRAAVV